MRARHATTRLALVLAFAAGVASCGSDGSEKTAAQESPAAAGHEGWTDGTLPGEGLHFSWPSGWTYAEDDEGVRIFDPSGFTVHVLAVQPGTAPARAGGACGACTFVRTVDSFTLDDAKVFLLDVIDQDGRSAGPVLSSCEGATKCAVTSATSANLIDAYLTYNAAVTPSPGEAGGPGGPQDFDTSLAGYASALKILESLSF